MTTTRYTLKQDTPEQEATRIAELRSQMLQAASINKNRDSAAAEAYGRLAALAETRNSGQIVRIAGFLAATFNSYEFKFDISDLRGLDESIRADILTVLAGQYGFAPYPYNLIPDGEARVGKIVEKFGIKPIIS